jgi:hypothetical protein
MSGLRRLVNRLQNSMILQTFVAWSARLSTPTFGEVVHFKRKLIFLFYLRLKAGLRLLKTQGLQ